MYGDGDRLELLTMKLRLWVVLVRDLMLMIDTMSDLSQLSCRKFACIQVFISVRRFSGVNRIALVMILVEMWIWTKSA